MSHASLWHTFTIYFISSSITFYFILILSAHLRIQHFTSLSRYFFCMMFTYVLKPFWEYSLASHKLYRFEIYLSVIWKLSFIMLPLFTKMHVPKMTRKLSTMPHFIYICLCKITTQFLENMFKDNSMKGIQIMDVFGTLVK